MRRCLLVVLICIFVSGLTPMAKAAIMPAIGFQTSLNVAKVSVPNLGSGESNKSRVAPSFGGRIEFPFLPFFALEAGANISMQGTKLEYNGPIYDNNGNLIDQNGSVTRTEKLTYLTVPVMGKFTLVPTGPARPYLKAGPAIGIKLSAKTKTEYNAGGQSGSQESDAKEAKSFDFGLGFGGGVDLGVAPKIDLFGEVGYTLGLMDVTDNAKAGNTDSNKNRVFAFGVGMMFHI